MASTWQTLIDSASGYPYYQNNITGETQWEMPEELQEQVARKPPPSLPPPNANAAAAASDPPLREPPPLPPLDSPPHAPIAASKPPPPMSTRPAYIQVVPGFQSNVQSSPQLQPQQVQQVQPQARPALARAASSNSTLPMGWTEHTDPNTGKKYFHNAAKGITTWERPSAPIPGDEWDTGSPVAPTSPTATSFQRTATTSGYEFMSSVNASIAGPNSRSNISGVRPELVSMTSKSRNPNQFASIFAGSINEEDMKSFTTGPDAAGIAKARAHAGHDGDHGKSIIHVKTNSINTLQALRAKGARNDLYKLSNYTTDRLTRWKKGLFGKMELEDMMMWQEKQIPDPLHKDLTPPHAERGKQVFRNITSFMGDRSSSKPPLGHVDKICRFGIDGPEILRDEIYLQVIKQMTNNPKRESVLKGWKLLCILSGIFAPSDDFGPYLQCYLQQAQDTNARNFEIKDMAIYIEERLASTLHNGPRVLPPMQLEVDVIERMRPFPLRVEFVDETFKTLVVESQTTVEEMIETICKKIRVPFDDTFALFQIATNHGELISERFLADTDRLMDVVTSWYEKREAYSKRHSKSDLKFKLLFKAKLFRESELGSLETMDPHLLQMFFKQGVMDITHSNLPTTDAQAFELAALQLQGQWGDANPGNHVQENIGKFLPKGVIQNKDYNHASQILNDRKKFLGIPKEEAQQHYLTFLMKTWDTYGALQFTAEQQAPATRAKDSIITVAINEKGVFLLDPLTRYVMRHIKLADVRDAQPSPDHTALLFTTGPVVRPEKFVLRTRLAGQMHALLALYQARNPSASLSVG